MNCTNCGNWLSDNVMFCPTCGTPVQGGYQTQGPPSNGLAMGYSNVIHSAEMKRLIEKRKKGIKTMIIGLLIILWVGLPGFALFSDEMEPMEAIIVAGFITLATTVVNVYSNIKGRKRNMAWEGDIVDKRVEQRVRKERDDDDDVRKVTVQENILYVKRLDNGKVMDINLYQNFDLFNYYNVGDRIKHHMDTYYYEKYDKTRDAAVVCVQCGAMNPLQVHVCTKCKMPLLK